LPLDRRLARTIPGSGPIATLVQARSGVLPRPVSGQACGVAVAPVNVHCNGLAMPKHTPQKPPVKGKSPQQHGALDNVRDGPALLARIADALERLAPAPSREPDFAAAEAFTWHPAGRRVVAVPRVSRSAWDCSRASTGSATSWSTTPSGLRAGCR
jgi:hypothetical protein